MSEVPPAGAPTITRMGFTGHCAASRTGASRRYYQFELAAAGSVALSHGRPSGHARHLRMPDGRRPWRSCHQHHRRSHEGDRGIRACGWRYVLGGRLGRAGGDEPWMLPGFTAPSPALIAGERSAAAAARALEARPQPQFSAWRAFPPSSQGIPAFFSPRQFSWSGVHALVGLDACIDYSTAPLRETLASRSTWTSQDGAPVNHRRCRERAEQRAALLR